MCSHRCLCLWVRSLLPEMVSLGRCRSTCLCPGRPNSVSCVTWAPAPQLAAGYTRGRSEGLRQCPLSLIAAVTAPSLLPCRSRAFCPLVGPWLPTLTGEALCCTQGSHWPCQALRPLTSADLSGCSKFMVSGCDGQCARTSLLSPVSAWLTPPPVVTHVSLPQRVSPSDEWEHGLIAYIAPPVDGSACRRSCAFFAGAGGGRVDGVLRGSRAVNRG